MSAGASRGPDEERRDGSRPGPTRPEPGLARVVPATTLDGGVAALPGLRPGAPRRNALVALSYLLVAATVALALLGQRPL